MRQRFELLEARQLLTVTSLATTDTYQRSAPWGLVEDGDVAWFSLFNAQRESQLWRTDGTASGTIQVEDDAGFVFNSQRDSMLRSAEDVAELINLDESLWIENLVPFGDGFAFVDGSSAEIWISDGTVDGTASVGNSEHRRNSSTPNPTIQPFGDELYVGQFWRVGLEKLSQESSSFEVVHEFDRNRFEHIDVRQFGDKLWVRVWGNSEGQLWTLDETSDGLTLVQDWSNRYPSWNDVAQLEDGRLVFTVGDERIVAPSFAPDQYEFSHRELWISDGTPEGTESLVSMDDGMIVDVQVGDQSVYYVALAADGNYDLMRLELTGTGESSRPEKLHDFDRLVGQFEDALQQVGSTIFFSDGSDLTGQRMSLYRFDAATPEATVELVRSFDGGFASSLMPWSGGALFTANDGAGDALWTSDGTSNGTIRLHEVDLSIRPAIFSYIPTDNYLLMHEAHVENTTTSNSTQRVWVRDLAGNLELIAEVPNASQFVVDGERLTGQLDEDPYGTQVLTDGTPEGTEFLRFGMPWPNLRFQEVVEQNVLFPADPLTIGDTTFFVRWTQDHGTELWALSDAEGERMVRDINPGEFDSHPGNFAAFDDILYFRARDRTTIFRFGDIEVEGDENWELWRSDGTEEGTYKVAELNPSPEAFPVFTSGSNPGNFRAVDRGFVFTAIFDGQRIGQTARFAGQGWFSSDGTTEGTFRLELLDGATPVAFPGNAPGFFAGSQGLLFTDGTVEGTRLIGSIPINGTFDIVTELGTANGLTFFATEHSNGVTIWQTDGSPEQTRALDIPVVNEVQVLWPLPPGQEIDPGERLLLSTKDDEGSSVWHVDGKREIEALRLQGDVSTLLDVITNRQRVAGNLGSPYRRVDSSAQYFAEENDLVFRVSWDGESNFERWVTDGAGRTFQIEKIADGPLFQLFDGERLWFVANDEALGEELWVTDGTQEGTFVYDLAPGEEGSYPRSLFMWRGDFYFDTNQFNHEERKAITRFWKSGTAELAADFNGDGIVDFADFLSLSHNFSREDATRAEGDANGDGMIDFADFLELSHSFNQLQPESLGTLEPLRRDFEGIEAIFASFS